MSIAAYLMAMAKTKEHKFYGAGIFGICSMQLAEAYLWYHGDLVETCSKGGGNRFGTQVLVSTALVLQPLGPFFGARRWMFDRGKWWFKYSLLYVIVPLSQAIPIPRYFLIGDDYKCEDLTFLKFYCGAMCAVVTPMGYLNWHMQNTPPLPMLLIWFAYISIVPMMVVRPVKKALFTCAYGLVCVLCSWSLTDSSGSNWCLYVSGYALLGLVDYHIYPFYADKKE